MKANSSSVGHSIRSQRSANVESANVVIVARVGTSAAQSTSANTKAIGAGLERWKGITKVLSNRWDDIYESRISVGREYSACISSDGEESGVFVAGNSHSIDCDVLCLSCRCNFTQEICLPILDTIGEEEHDARDSRPYVLVEDLYSLVQSTRGAGESVLDFVIFDDDK